MVKEHSPIPEKKVEEVKMMSFPEAMLKVIQDKTVARFEWEDKSIVCKLEPIPTKEDVTHRRLMIRIEKVWRPWLISEGDMISKDWIVVE